MLKELKTQHRTLIQMAFSGYKNNEIAERLEMSASAVSTIIRSPLGQAYLDGMQDKAKEATLDVRKKLVSLNSSALKTLERVMNPAEKAPHSVQLGAAKDVLDRTGYKAPDKLHVDMTMQTKTDQEIDAEISAMQQSITKTYAQSPGAPRQVNSPVPSSKLGDNGAPEGIAKTINKTSLNKALKEQISKTISVTAPDLFINEQAIAKIKTVESKDIDSSEKLVSLHKTKQDFPDELNMPNKLNQKSSNLPNSSIDLISEESISLLSNIPADIFK